MISSEVPALVEDSKAAPEEKPKVLKNVPYVTVDSVAAAAQEFFNGHSLYLGRGNTGLVIRVGSLAAKFGLVYELPQKVSAQLASFVHPDNVRRQQLLAEKLGDSVRHATSFEQQAAASVIGSQVRPDLVDGKVAIISSQGKACGLLMPYYQGEFLPVSDPRLGITTHDLQELQAAGIKVDDFAYRANAVLLPNGEKRLFDLEVPPTRLQA